MIRQFFPLCQKNLWTQCHGNQQSEYINNLKIDDIPVGYATDEFGTSKVVESNACSLQW
jgi:hypothetical protein